jgi:2-phosphosulfolactate phosphatase
VPHLSLHTLPQHVTPEQLAGSTVIIVDQLRASSTIATALAAGAECVMPFAEVDETLATAKQFGRATVLLGGERGGKRIPGFDLGNSPAEYTPERVAGRRILFTTTNGARALQHVRGARRILVGAAVNCAAVANAVEPGADVAIICAGTDGVIAFEDRLAGGAIVEALARRGATWIFNEAATAALDRWRRIGEEARARSVPLADVFVERMTETDGGQNLIAIGQDADLARCAILDSLNVAPELNHAANELRARHSR